MDLTDQGHRTNRRPAHHARFTWRACLRWPTHIAAGFNADGLPMGLQLIGRPQGDAALLRLAWAYENAAREVLDVRPPPEPPSNRPKQFSGDYS